MRHTSKTKIHSTDVHISVPQKASFTGASFGKKISIFVIFTSMLLVILFTVFAILYRPDNIVRYKINNLATDYYENYYYNQFADRDDLEEIMQKYTERGFSRITLRQLLLHDYEKNLETANYLRKYCDENKTYLYIFPDPPFTKTSYHIEYYYACDF